MVRTTRRKAPTPTAVLRLLKMAGGAESIEDAVRSVVQMYFGDIPGPPIDLNAAASKLNVALCEEDVPVSGELRKKGKDYTIVVSSHLSPNRKRFTIAHEMAHLLFERSGRNPPRTGKEVERLCDLLASEILMPARLLESLHEDAAPHRVVQLSELFGTSVQAAAIRYSRLKKVSVFQIEGDNVIWGTGVVRKGPVKDLDFGIRSIISKIGANGEGSQILLFDHSTWSGEWKLSWETFQRRRPLFLMHPHKSFASYV